MRGRPIILMLVICSTILIMSSIIERGSTQMLLVDDATVSALGSDNYTFEVLSNKPAVIGVRPLNGGNFNIEVYEDTTFATSIESSASAGYAVNFVALEKNKWASPPNRAVRVTSGTTDYVLEMENEIEKHTMRDTWVGTMEVSLGGPVLNIGSPGSWDDEGVYTPTVVYDGTTFHMWYTGYDGSTNRVGYANSTDGIEWVKHSSYVLDVGPSGDWDGEGVSDPSVHYDGGEFHMWYSGFDGTYMKIGYANSSDGINWEKYDRIITPSPYSESDPVLDVGETPGAWDGGRVCQPSVLYNGIKYHMWYAGYDGSNYQIGYADSYNGLLWTKSLANPVLDLSLDGAWDERHVYEPSVLYDGLTFHMWYGGDNWHNTRIGYATSYTGITWTKYPKNPVLDIGSPSTWDDSHSTAPAVLYDGSTYHMWYSGHDGKNYRIGYATSPDNSSWAKLTSSAQVIDAYEIIGLKAGLDYKVDLDVPSTVDLDLFIFSSTGGRDDAVASSTNAGTGVDESIKFTAPTTGDYILVITNEDGGTGTYTVLPRGPPLVFAGKDLTADENGTVIFKGEAYYPGFIQDSKPCRVWPVDISGDGRYLAIGWGNNVTFFSTSSNIPLWTLDTGGKVDDLKLTENGQYLIVGSYETLYFFDTNSSVPLWTFNFGKGFNKGPGNYLDMTRDGKYVASIAKGNRVIVFDTKNATIPYWDYDFGDKVKLVKFSGDGRYLAMGGNHNHEFRLGWIPGRSINWTYSNDDVFYSSSLSYDGSKISTGQGVQHKVSLFNSSSSAPVWSLDLMGAQIEQVMTEDGKYFASSNTRYSEDTWSGFAFWDTENSTPIWTYKISTGDYLRTEAIDMDLNSNYVVGGSWNGKVYLFSQLSDGESGWSSEDGTPVYIYPTGGYMLYNGVSISAEGTYFAAGSRDGSVYLFTTVGGPRLLWSWDSSSSSPAPSSFTYTWDFDANVDSDNDGNFTNDVNAIGPNATLNYSKDGVYIVTLTVMDEEGIFNTDTVIVTVDNEKPLVSVLKFLEPWAGIITAAIIAAILGSLITCSTEVGKYRFFPLFFPLYSRLKKKEVLDQFTRGRIYEHIRKNPGDHYNSIKLELELNNGALAYHLRTLEKENYIKSTRDGIYKRFYPVGMQIPEETERWLSEIQENIIKAIRQKPGATQKEISRKLNISQQAVSYHVNIMIDSGVLRSERYGKALRYFINAQ